MKKVLIAFVGSLIVVGVLSFNISIGLESDHNTKTELKNIEALACYSMEQNDTYMWDCCYPYIPYCYLYNGVNFSGTITFW